MESKNEAIKLRIQGKSYNEITSILGVPKSTLSYWLKDIKISEELKCKLLERSKNGIKALIKRNKEQTLIAQKKAKDLISINSKNISILNYQDLKIIGIGLYMGEGGKGCNRIDFTNSNPAIIRIIMSFFREICNVKDKKFRFQLTIYDKESLEDILKFWLDVTKCDRSQFIATNYKISKYSQKKRKNKLPYGTIQIRICDVNLLNKIKGWILGVTKQF